MSEAQGSSSQTDAKARPASECWRRIQKGIDEIVDAFTPPEAVRNHFLEARIEILRGIREMIDYRIDRLSRNKGTPGSRVVVE